MAQLVACSTVSRCVVGSSPTRVTGHFGFLGYLGLPTGSTTG